jgi:hypothetical protein
MMELVQIKAPYFTAGIKLKNEICTVAAPILKWCIGHESEYLKARFQRLKWKAIIVGMNQ